MKSNFSRPFRFNSWISTKFYQEKVTETKDQKVHDRTVRDGIFHPMITCVYNDHYQVSISEHGNPVRSRAQTSDLMLDAFQQFDAKVSQAKSGKQMRENSDGYFRRKLCRERTDNTKMALPF